MALTMGDGKGNSNGAWGEFWERKYNPYHFSGGHNRKAKMRDAKKSQEVNIRRGHEDVTIAELQDRVFDLNKYKEEVKISMCGAACAVWGGGDCRCVCSSREIETPSGGRGGGEYVVKG